MNILKIVQGWVKIKGDTDGTKIGNKGDLLQVNIPESEVDVGNSTSTLLGVSGVFTGAWVDALNFSSICITAITDQYSAIDGVVLQFSKTASDSDLVRELDTTMMPSTEGIFFSIPVEAQYYRLIYTNGAVAQTVFRLTTVCKKHSIGISSSPLISTITDISSANLTKAIVAGKDIITGNYENITTEGGRLRTETISVTRPLEELVSVYAENGGSREMNVDGDPTPVEFIINADATEDVDFQTLAFESLASGIKIDKFLGLNSELSNGILIEIKSDDKVSTFIPIKNTTEFNSIFSLGDSGSFDLVFASGNDSMVARFGPNSPFVIRKQGTFGTDDYIKVIIRDDIDQINRLRFIGTGRVRGVV